MMTHTCTNCKTIKHYDNKGSWYNARTTLNKTGRLLCASCAGTIGRASSSIKPTGRPIGSRTCQERLGGHSRPGAGMRLNDSLTFDKRMQGIAKRNGYQTYQDYKDSLPAWKAYKIDVWRITNQQPIQQLENFNRRGVNGQTGAYTLDHIISIKKGFIENTPPEQIGHIDNLQMLPWEENITKGWK